MSRWIGLLARLVVGGVWLCAGLLKVGDPAASVSAVRAYQLLPYDVAETLGRALPMLEVVLGACLIGGLLTRFGGALSAVLQLAFIAGIASVWSRDIAINCGCFGDGGPNPHAFSQYPWEIARDVGLLAVSLLLAWRPRTPYAADGVLFEMFSGAPTTQEEDDLVPAES